MKEGWAKGLVRRNHVSNGGGPAEHRAPRGTDARGFFLCRICKNFLRRVLVV